MRAFAEGGAGALPIYWEQDSSPMSPAIPTAARAMPVSWWGIRPPLVPSSRGLCPVRAALLPEVVIEDSDGPNQPPVAVITGPSQAEGARPSPCPGRHRPILKGSVALSVDPAGGRERGGTGISSIWRLRCHARPLTPRCSLFSGSPMIRAPVTPPSMCCWSRVPAAAIPRTIRPTRKASVSGRGHRQQSGGLYPRSRTEGLIWMYFYR